MKHYTDEHLRAIDEKAKKTGEIISNIFILIDNLCKIDPTSEPININGILFSANAQINQAEEQINNLHMELYELIKIKRTRKIKEVVAQEEK